MARRSKTYVTELQLSKVDGSNAALAGAEFTLTGTNLNKVKFTAGTAYELDKNGTYYKLATGAYTTDVPTEDNSNLYDSTTNKYKQVTVLTAAKESDTANGKGGTVNWGVTDKDGETISSVTAANGVLSTTVVNNAGSVLPSTGGISTTIFYVLGSVLVLGAAVVLIARKRMNSEKA